MTNTNDFLKEKDFLAQLEGSINKNYSILMKALKDREAKAKRDYARTCADACEFDYENPTSEQSRLHIKLSDEYYKTEGEVKKAVNAFFRTSGQLPQRYEFAHHALKRFDDYILNTEVFHCEPSPFVKLSLYNIKNWTA